ncbi:MAG: chorismate mutase [Spirochaetia bacterium]
MKAPLSLPQIAARLEALEETIIMRFIDRAQFAANPDAYAAGRSGFEGAGDESLFDLRLWAQESMDAQFGRYMVPEERPVSSNLPAPKREVHLPPLPLCVTNYEIVSRSVSIRDAYLECLPSLCAGGDDGQYGSAVEHDVYAIQAIARRVHYGALYVAEAKFRADPGPYTEAALAGEDDRLLRMLTRPEVEQGIVERLRQKVEDLQSQVNTRVRKVIGAEVIIRFYENTVIPLTKSGQISYLRERAKLSEDTA